MHVCLVHLVHVCFLMQLMTVMHGNIAEAVYILTMFSDFVTDFSRIVRLQTIEEASDHLFQTFHCVGLFSHDSCIEHLLILMYSWNNGETCPFNVIKMCYMQDLIDFSSVLFIST